MPRASWRPARPLMRHVEAIAYMVFGTRAKLDDAWLNVPMYGQPSMDLQGLLQGV